MRNPWIPTKQLDPDMPESVFEFNKTENSGTTSKEANSVLITSTLACNLFSKLVLAAFIVERKMKV